MHSRPTSTMHFNGVAFAAFHLHLATTAVFGIHLDFLPQTIFRVGMLINVPFFDNMFHGLMFRGNYPIYPQISSNSSLALDRWALYSSLEGVLERLGVAGRPCMLRAVCEAAANHLDHDGLLGAALHLVLSPSSSADDTTKKWHEEYVEAEKYGLESQDCAAKYIDKCQKSVLDVFTKLN